MALTASWILSPDISHTGGSSFSIRIRGRAAVQSATNAELFDAVLQSRDPKILKNKLVDSGGKL